MSFLREGIRGSEFVHFPLAPQGIVDIYRFKFWGLILKIYGEQNE